MANTNKYLGHLLQNTGITPACSEEERAAADMLAKIFENHGFQPEVQEFSASAGPKIAQAIMGIMVFVGSVLAGIGGAAGIVGLLLCVIAAVLFELERRGTPVLSQIGFGGLSQNVIAYHQASGPLASPRNRPVVVVAHYDSPRADFLCQQPFAPYRSILAKLLPFAMVVPAALVIIRMFPVGVAGKTVLWILAIICALIPLISAASIIANRFFMPYTSGSVCNKSSVAAMLGVMDAVSPYAGAAEFPQDVPFDEYHEEQRRIVEAAAAAAAEAAPEYPHEAEEGDDLILEDEELVEVAPDGEEIVEEEVIEETSPADDQKTVGFTVVTDAPSSMSTVQMDAAALAAAAEAAAEGDDVEDPDETIQAPVPDDDQTIEFKALASDELIETEVRQDAVVEQESEPEVLFHVNHEGNIRFGADKIRALGMLAPSCTLVYEPEPEPVVVETPAEAPHTTSIYDRFEVIETVVPDEPPTEVPLPMAYEDDDEVVEYDEPVYEDDTTDEDEEVEVIEEVDVPADASDFIATAEWEPIEDASVEEDISVEAEASAFEEPERSQAADRADAPAEAEQASEATQLFSAQPAAEDMTHTVAMPAQPAARPAETVDSIMADVSRSAHPQRVINVPSTTDAPAPHVPVTANRASLFDLPDPSATPIDPFASDDAVQPAPMEEPSAPEVTPVSPVKPPVSVISERIETISAPAPKRESERRGLGRLFGRRKKEDDRMSEWLGVDDGFDAKVSGGDIGSWDNFDDDDAWKGGATSMEDMSEEELRDAIASMGADELLGHDIWFVATGASENEHAGMQAFLDSHRDKLRGVFLINLECVGSGQLAMLATEGGRRVLKGDKRIMKLVSQVSDDFHHECLTVDMPYVTTDAYVAMNMSLRSLTLGGVDATGFSCSHTEDDQPYNVDPENVALASDIVTEVIRRS